MENEPKDKNLDIPGEANTQKHINFRQVEEESAAAGDINNSADVDKEKGPLYMHDENPFKMVQRAANEIRRTSDSDEHADPNL